MTQGDLEKLPLELQKIFSELEIRIMEDVVRRIKINEFSTATADWQISRLQQLGESEANIKAWIKEALEASDEELDKIFSDVLYEQYVGNQRAYHLYGLEQIPFEENVPLQQLIEATKQQISTEYKNLANSMGFAIRDASGKITYTPLLEYYRNTLDNAVIDIQSGAFSYQTVLERTINNVTMSGVRWIDYDSGWHNRVDVAARRAVLTGFRQVQGKINEQVAADLGTDSYETTYHVGARPEHQPWQGRVYTMEELINVCGLGTVTGLCGANCYHNYSAFIPGVSVRTYTDGQLDEMLAQENTPKKYLGKEYTTYEALQRQRALETSIRKCRQDIHLMETGGAAPAAVLLKKGKYKGKMQEYRAFSEAMDLPMQKQRIYQDGLKVGFGSTASNHHGRMGAASGFVYKREYVHFDEKNDYSIHIDGYSQDVNIGLSEAALKVAKKGSKDGYEHMYLVNLESGDLEYYETSGIDENVGVKYAKYLQKEENQHKKFAIVHNHNIISSLSEWDLLTPITNHNIELQIAVQNDGVKYIAKKTKNAHTGFSPDVQYANELQELNELSRHGKITPIERNRQREEIIVEQMLNEFYGEGMIISDGKNK